MVQADILETTCISLNPKVPKEIIEQVVTKVLDRRGAMSAVAANHELDGWIRDGVSVEFDDEAGGKQFEKVRLIDFDNPKNNNYLAVS